MLEVATTKRLKSAPRSTTTKRKVLMDDPMVLHGEYVYLTDLFLCHSFYFFLVLNSPCFARRCKAAKVNSKVM